MATWRVPILGWASVPDSSGNVWLEPYDIAATNDVWKRQVMRFKDTATRIGCHGGFVVPKNYVNNAKVVARWTSTVTTGNVQLSFDYRTVAVGSSLDQAGTEESINSGAVAAPGSANLLKETSITATAGNFAVDDEVEFTVFRDGTSGNDTMVGDVLLFSLLFEYTDV